MLHCVTITRFVAPRHVIVIGTDTSSLTLVTPQVSHYRPIFGLYTTWSTDCHACSLLLEMCPCRGCFSLVWLHRWFVYDTAGQRFRVMCPLSPSSTVLVSFGVARACMHAPALTSVCMYASASAGSVNGCAACVSTPDGVVVNTSSRDQLQTLASLQDECVLYMHESRTN